MSEILIQLLGVNLFVGLGVAAVMALRLPARRLFGARIAYGLWALAPLAGLAMLLPSRVVRIAAAPAATDIPIDGVAALPVSPAATPGFDPAVVGLVVWIAGGLASLGYLAWRQHQFGRAVRDGRAGPAVVGVIKPRIVTPDDFDGLYTPREQQVVLAHERTHIARHDARVNALVALARCVAWFNPLVHVLAHYLRVDQELACDAQVVAAYPQARRAYAEAMLKTQLAARPLPLGCYWPAQAAHPLADRIRLLGQASPGRWRRLAGQGAVAALALSAVGTAWAAKPVRVIATPAASSPVIAAAPEARPAAAVHMPNTVAAASPAAQANPTPEPQPDPNAEERAAADPQPAVAITAAPQPRTLRPLIEPGTAVRIRASTIDPDGVALSSDMTSYGSNPLRRTGSYRRVGSQYGLFTSVFQTGDRYAVTATLTHERQPVVAGSVSLKAGETAEIQLANGEVVTVSVTARPETAEETDAGQALELAKAADRDDRRYRTRSPRAAGPVY